MRAIINDSPFSSTLDFVKPEDVVRSCLHAKNKVGPKLGEVVGRVKGSERLEVQRGQTRQHKLQGNKSLQIRYKLRRLLSRKWGNM